MVEIPRYLADGARRGFVTPDWLDALPSVIEQASERWGLVVGAPYEPGGACAWVAPAGSDRVLKILQRDRESEHEADGLALWDGRGAVRLFDSHTDGTTTVLLLERCEPGTPLRDALPPREQDEIVADRLLHLWITPPDDRFRPLSQMTRLWIRTLERDLAEQHYDPDPGFVDEARRIYQEEGNNVSDVRLLCTDLHGGNILAAQREPWLVIDPKPFVGDPAYDVVQHMLNHIPRLEDDPFAFADRMASLTGCDPGRVRMWLFARAMQESLGDEPYQRALRPVAARLARR